MTRLAAIASLAPLAIALTACGDDPEPAPALENDGAEGDVLERSISDEMLPLDSLQSSAPSASDDDNDPAGDDDESDANGSDAGGS